jgi:hypothetical protein
VFPPHFSQKHSGTQKNVTLKNTKENLMEITKAIHQVEQKGITIYLHKREADELWDELLLLPFSPFIKTVLEKLNEIFRNNRSGYLIFKWELGLSGSPTWTADDLRRLEKRYGLVGPFNCGRCGRSLKGETIYKGSYTFPYTLCSNC